MAANRPPRPRRAQVRARILASAAAVFARQGFAGATIDDVAAAAGFTKGAVYSNFTNKDELFLALMDAQVQARVDLVAGLLTDVQLHGTALSSHTLRTIGDQLARATSAEPDWHLLFLEFWQRAMREPVVREQFIAHRRALRAAIAEVARGALPAGADWLPDEAAVLVLALSNGLAIETLADSADIAPELFGRALAALADLPAASSNDR